MSDISIPSPSEEAEEERDARDRVAFEKTRNPVYAWMALSRYAGHEPLPAWVRRYLLEASAPVLRAAHPESGTAPVPALQYILRALGFVRPGWNSVEQYREDRKTGFTALVYGLTAVKGRTKVAADAIGKRRTVQHHIKRYKDLGGKMQ
jgi:hypothetical protein